MSCQCKTLPCERRPRYRYLIFTKYNIVMSCSHRHNLLAICNYRGMIAYGAGQCVIFFLLRKHAGCPCVYAIGVIQPTKGSTMLLFLVFSGRKAFGW